MRFGEVFVAVEEPVEVAAEPDGTFVLDVRGDGQLLTLAVERAELEALGERIREALTA